MPRKAYGDNSMSQNMVHYYHKMFWDGRENAEDEDLSRCPYTSHSNQNVEKLRDTLTSDRRQIVKMLGSPEKALKQSDTLQQYLASSAWQRAIANHLHFHKVLSKTWCGNTVPASVQSRLGTIGLLVPEDQDGTQGPLFRNFESHQRNYIFKIDTFNTIEYLN